MDAPYGDPPPLLHPAPCLPSQPCRPDDEYHGLQLYSSAAPIPSIQAPFLPSVSSADQAMYNRWAMAESFPYSSFAPYGESSGLELKSDPASPLYMDGTRASTSLPGSYSSYQGTSVVAYHSPNSSGGEPQQSCPPPQAYTSPPTPMPGYNLYQQTASLPHLPNLAPMPAGGLNENPSPPSSRRRRQTIAAVLPSRREPQPTLVVGSQGRRGILPSAIGCPAAVSGEIATGQRSTNVAVKDKNGKFPCPHCVKTYLHAKHLKRHLLRHTGIRPYSCGLCAETFSRSDILKRHFEKCSARRGNPSGATHLDHSRAAKQSTMEAAEKVQQVQQVIFGASQDRENEFLWGATLFPSEFPTASDGGFPFRPDREPPPASVSLSLKYHL